MAAYTVGSLRLLSVTFFNYFILQSARQSYDIGVFLVFFEECFAFCYVFGIFALLLCESLYSLLQVLLRFCYVLSVLFFLFVQSLYCIFDIFFGFQNVLLRLLDIFARLLNIFLICLPFPKSRLLIEYTNIALVYCIGKLLLSFYEVKFLFFEIFLFFGYGFAFFGYSLLRVLLRLQKFFFPRGYGFFLRSYSFLCRPLSFKQICFRIEYRLAVIFKLVCFLLLVYETLQCIFYFVVLLFKFRRGVFGIVNFLIEIRLRFFDIVYAVFGLFISFHDGRDFIALLLQYFAYRKQRCRSLFVFVSESLIVCGCYFLDIRVELLVIFIVCISGFAAIKIGKFVSYGTMTPCTLGTRLFCFYAESSQLFGIVLV